MPGLESQGIGAVSQACVEVVEEVDAAGVAEGDGLLAGAEAEGLEEVALAGAALAGDDEVIVTLNEAELRELQDGLLSSVG